MMLWGFIMIINYWLCKKAHDIDPNLTSHVMCENLIVKASAALVLKHLLNQNKIER